MSLLSSQPKNTKSGAGAALLHGTDIAKVLSSTGPVVKAVLLKHIRNDGRDGKPHHVPPRASSAISTAKVDQANSEPKAAPKSDETAQTDEQKTDQHSNKNEQNGNHQNPPHRVVLTELIEEVLVDTTPSKNAVKTILGGPFTFLGQYPDEGTIVMARRDLPILDSTDSDEEEDGDKNDGNQLMNADAKALYELSVKELKALCSEYYGDDMDTATIVEKSELVDAILQAQLPINPHQLQPPFDGIVVRGDILIMKVAPTNEELDDDDEDGEENEDDNEENENGDDTQHNEENEEGEQDRIEDKNETSGSKKQSISSDQVRKVENDTSNVKRGPATKNECPTGDNTESDTKPETLEKTDAEDDEDDHAKIEVPTNEEFFLDYTKEEYIAFASRTDIVAPDLPEYFYEEDDSDEDLEDREEDDEDYEFGREDEEEEEKKVMLHIFMSECIRQFRESNGRGPNSTELLELRSQVAEKLGICVPTAEEILAAKEESKKRRAEDGENGCQRHPSKRVQFSGIIEELPAHSPIDDEKQPENTSKEEEDVKDIAELSEKEKEGDTANAT